MRVRFYLVCLGFLAMVLITSFSAVIANCGNVRRGISLCIKHLTLRANTDLSFFLK